LSRTNSIAARRRVASAWGGRASTVSVMGWTDSD
jgi:hypothetical protein